MNDVERDKIASEYSLFFLLFIFLDIISIFLFEEE